MGGIGEIRDSSVKSEPWSKLWLPTERSFDDQTNVVIREVLGKLEMLVWNQLSVSSAHCSDHEAL